MYRGMTHYEFILALHTVLSAYKTHYKFRFLYFCITKPYPWVKNISIFLHFELIVCFCELSTVSKNKHEHIVCYCPVHGAPCQTHELSVTRSVITTCVRWNILPLQLTLIISGQPLKPGLHQNLGANQCSFNKIFFDAIHSVHEIYAWKCVIRWPQLLVLRLEGDENSNQKKDN